MRGTTSVEHVPATAEILQLTKPLNRVSTFSATVNEEFLQPFRAYEEFFFSRSEQQTRDKSIGTGGASSGKVISKKLSPVSMVKSDSGLSVGKCALNSCRFIARRRCLSTTSSMCICHSGCCVIASVSLTLTCQYGPLYASAVGHTPGSDHYERVNDAIEDAPEVVRKIADKQVNPISELFDLDSQDTPTCQIVFVPSHRTRLRRKVVL